MNDIDYIKNFASDFKRSKFQINDIFESDSELLDFTQILGSNLLAVSTDSISEEIEYGIYRDPYLIGWMLIVSNISDLSAVGATPLGALINLTFEHANKDNSEYLTRLRDGIIDAVDKCGIHIFGGDTNFSSKTNYAATVFGKVDPNFKMTRKGAKPGDLLYTTDKVGLGNCFAANLIFDMNLDIEYQPAPRIDEGQIIRKYASSCMDTSDGLVHALAQLITLNDIGFGLNAPLTDYIRPECFSLSEKIGEPALVFLAGILGEYELVFTVPEEQNEVFIQDATDHDFSPVYLGRVLEDPKLSVKVGEHDIPIQYKAILEDTSTNLGEYISNLRNLFRQQ